MITMVSKAIATIVALSAYYGSRTLSSRKIKEFSVWTQSMNGVSSSP